MKFFFVKKQEFSFHILLQFSTRLKQKLTIQNMAKTQSSEQMKEIFIIYIINNIIIGPLTSLSAVLIMKNTEISFLF